MCHPSVIATVARAAFEAGSGTAAGSAAPLRVEITGSHERVVDLTHELTADFPSYDGEQQFFMDAEFTYENDGMNLFKLRLDEHVGTHIDAPLHFSANGKSVAEIPLDELVVPLCVIDIRARADKDNEAQMTPDDITAWIAGNGPIPQNACIALHSGWADRVRSGRYRNEGQDGKMRFPGFHPETARMLLEEGAAIGLASDTMSIDIGSSTDYPVHAMWLPSERWALENVAGLEQVPASGATLVVGSPKHRGGSGGPTRLFALI